jgi:hypothetical protein
MSDLAAIGLARYDPKITPKQIAKLVAWLAVATATGTRLAADSACPPRKLARHMGADPAAAWAQLL